MATPLQLRRIAAESRRAVDKLRRKADQLERQAVMLEKAAEEAETTSEALHKRLRESTVNEPMMDKSHRLAISKGHRDAGDPFAKAIRKAGFSQNGLAKRLHINQALISLHRKRVRKIPMSRAKAIETLTGWPADLKHWPVGIVTDGE